MSKEIKAKTKTMTKEKKEALGIGETLCDGFGDGWMTRAATDLFRVMVGFANFDKVELIFAIHKRKRNREGLVNCRTVENAAQDITDAWWAELRRLEALIMPELGDPT